MSFAIEKVEVEQWVEEEKVKLSGRRAGHSWAGLITCANVEPIHHYYFDRLASNSSMEAFDDIGMKVEEFGLYERSWSERWRSKVETRD